MTYTKAISTLQALERDILVDGKVDMKETEQLVRFINPVLSQFGASLGQFLDLLDRCRADGTITKGESELLAANLELVCARFTIKRQRFWMIVMGVALAILALMQLFR